MQRVECQGSPPHIYVSRHNETPSPWLPCVLPFWFCDSHQRRQDLKLLSSAIGSDGAWMALWTRLTTILWAPPRLSAALLSIRKHSRLLALIASHASRRVVPRPLLSSLLSRRQVPRCAAISSLHKKTGVWCLRYVFLICMLRSHVSTTLPAGELL